MASVKYQDSNMSESRNATRTMNNDDISVQATIAIYSTIFVLSVVGNGLVILTLVRNKRMRTVTNVFLLNLAVSDLLLAVFCMPFTLIPNIIRNFIFGPFICISIRYAQGVSVGASCFTLVAISLERYFAICRPLHSRRWQTLSHAYKTIAGCWITSSIIVIPIAISTQHIELRPGHGRCREFWSSIALEQAYTVFLDVILLLIPLCLMTGAYARIMATLCTGIMIDGPSDTNSKTGSMSVAKMVSLKSTSIRSYVLRNGKSPDSARSSPIRNYTSIQLREIGKHDTPCTSEESTPRKKTDHSRIIRQTNYEKSRTAKLRVVKMLFVLVVEFFVCWAPLYTVQTWRSFHAESMKNSISSLTWSAMFLLSYLSSCCNPITYCFMNKRFRQSFMSTLRCCTCCRREQTFYSFSKTRTSTRRFTWLETQKLDDSSSNEKSKNGSAVVL